jgi:DNA topoisomerase-6 subunit B
LRALILRFKALGAEILGGISMETTGGYSESPPEPKKGKSKTPRKAKESVLKQSQSLSLSLSLSLSHIYVCISVCISRNDFLFFLFAESPAEFFAENKNIAGFDNVSFIYLIFE